MNCEGTRKSYSWCAGMVEFCAKCGTYIPPRRRNCPRCKPAEETPFKRINRAVDDLSVDDVINQFPSPRFRRYQREAIAATIQAYRSGKKCVIIVAPTGFGKSYLAAAFTSITKSFYVTPQLALIDQLISDPNLRARFVDIKGRQNYKCHYNPQRGVHVGKCVTDGYPCNERLDVCPYWMQKHLALQAPSVLMSLAYLILEGTTEGSETYLGRRDLLVLDEAHNLEEHCLNHVSLKFSPFSVPYEVYHKLLPDLKKVGSRSELDAFLAETADYLKLMLGRLQTKSEQGEISLLEAENKTLMERFIESYTLFTFSNSEWVWEIRNDQLLLQPVFAKEFMKDLVWKRGEHYLISSATILDPEQYVELTGLTDLLEMDEIEILNIPSTFPPENRPIIDATVGPLTKQQWDDNMPQAVVAVEEILHKEKGNVAIHAHSYRHQRALISNLSPNLKRRLIVHSADDREEKLQEWMRSRGKVFVSVAFNEGQDWKYDVCSAQILLKAPFPDLGDRRVKRRLELGYRQWYQNQAMLEIIQAYGRAVRAEDDAARFYVVDGSCTDLIKNSWRFIPDWFKDALPSTFKPATQNLQAE
ncbi:MAG TPA: ATP-dependent DNA helicase [Candidatus Dormibacteraeota bacterium]|nr:ATP-dependent DNA helicase [Candidatus Dormibacteraeota bacterium]